MECSKLKSHLFPESAIKEHIIITPRTILFDTINKHIYLSVGASCNACRESDPERGTILQFNIDGTNRKVFASGLRNALWACHQSGNNELWAANADRDNITEDIPEE